jgi:putative flavoprotein involved in K+ transport
LAETVAWRKSDLAVHPLEFSRSGIASVVWCTGFRGDFSYVKLPDALDAGGQPVHTDGVGVLPGLYFAGLDFASTRKSGIILAITEEGSRLVEHIELRRAN